jgi:hypothetical protein
MALGVAFVALSLVADKSAMFVGLSFVPDRKQHVVTGTVVEWRAGEFIAVGNEQNPVSLAMALRHNTVYEGDTHAIKSGIRVSVWFRNVSERHLVVEKVRVLDAIAR